MYASESESSGFRGILGEDGLSEDGWELELEEGGGEALLDGKGGPKVKREGTDVFSDANLPRRRRGRKG